MTTEQKLSMIKSLMGQIQDDVNVERDFTVSNQGLTKMSFAEIVQMTRLFKVEPRKPKWIATTWISQGINDVRGGEWEALDSEEVEGPMEDYRFMSDDGSTFYHVITEQEQDDE